MATSESDDFESADEELIARTERTNRSKKYNSIGSDSDDDQDFIPVQYHTPMKRPSREEARNLEQQTSNSIGKTDKKSKTMDKTDKESSKDEKQDNSEKSNSKVTLESKTDTNVEAPSEKPKETINRRERPQRQRKPKEVQSLGAKKLGATKIDKLPEPESLTPDQQKAKAVAEGRPPPNIQTCWELPDELNRLEQLNKKENSKTKESLTPDQQRAKAIAEGRPPPNIQTCWELPDELNRLEQLDKKENSETKEIDEENIPEELKSNLKFKDLFKPDGWEGISDDVELPDDLSDDKYQPVLDKLTEQKNTSDSWGSWGSWGVSSLLNTATMSVSTLTSHVSQGLSLLEESMGVPDPVDLAQTENSTKEEAKLEDKKPKEPTEKPEEQAKEEFKEEASPFPSFGFGNFLSSMSSITKLVESTSSKVITGGLDTLEVIGKKTMEVLQEGDPGLKKKRAFFTNDANKPILSHILREAKEKADIEEKSAEEKEQARKVHFESLFDDYQGLVHLEALEMLSKQCNMKIQQQLINVDGNDLTSMQETLDEVKELCDLGDEDEDDEEKDKELKQRLDEACKDLGVTITYDKLIDVWNRMKIEVENEVSPREMYQKAVSSLAQFTAYSVERFHKTAELLLIKPRRSTVNEADSLVQLTKTLSCQISTIANLYCDKLEKLKEETIESDVNTYTVAICLEGANASSYVQEAFRLLIPILQVGAI